MDWTQLEEVPNVPECSKEQETLSSNIKGQGSPAKHFVFTHNNYTESDLEEWKNVAKDPNVELLIFQSEKGLETGTPHLQGMISFKGKRRWNNIVSSKVPSFQVRKGSKISNILYCTKTSTWSEPWIRFYHGWSAPETVKTIEPTRWWQKEILEHISKPPDDRTIYWYHGPGKMGKTSFAKYLTVHHKATPLNGKGADMRMGVCDYLEKFGSTPKLIVVPIPRSYSCEYLSYEGLETVKDMYFYSSKYKGGVVCGNPCHLVVLANEPPDVTRMSRDRWVVVDIEVQPSRVGG